MQTEKRAVVRTREIELWTNVVANVEFVVRAALHDSVEDDFIHSIAGRIIAEAGSRAEEDAGQIGASLVQFGDLLSPEFGPPPHLPALGLWLRSYALAALDTRSERKYSRVCHYLITSAGAADVAIWLGLVEEGHRALLR